MFGCSSADPIRVEQDRIDDCRQPIDGLEILEIPLTAWGRP
jgi:hypothetical protein